MELGFAFGASSHTRSKKWSGVNTCEVVIEFRLELEAAHVRLLRSHHSLATPHPKKDLRKYLARISVSNMSQTLMIVYRTSVRRSERKFFFPADALVFPFLRIPLPFLHLPCMPNIQNRFSGTMYDTCLKNIGKAVSPGWRPPFDNSRKSQGNLTPPDLVCKCKTWWEMVDSDFESKSKLNLINLQNRVDVTSISQITKPASDSQRIDIKARKLKPLWLDLTVTFQVVRTVFPLPSQALISLGKWLRPRHITRVRHLHLGLGWG